MSAVSSPDRSLLARPDFVRLWIAGGCSNGTMWLEVLSASLFTFEVTRSGWDVALVSAARALPLLLLGAAAGVISDAWNRKNIVVAGLLVSAMSAAAVAALSVAGLARPWHIAVAGFVSGMGYATELPARRRMVGESAGMDRVDTAIAVDSLTGYASRSLGPLFGGVAFAHVGLSGAFAISLLCNGLAALLVADSSYRQAVHRRASGPFFRDLRVAIDFAIRSPALLALLAVTVTMNLCGYAYATLMAPVGLQSLHLDSALTGVLAAAEPAGAFAGGVVLTRRVLRGPRLTWLMAGVAILTVALVCTAGLGGVGAPLAALCLVLACGGVGSAIYNNTQTGILILETPAELRSRLMGLVTVCIGSWPFGMLLAGGLVQAMPPLAALAALAGLGLILLGGIVLARRHWPARDGG